MEKGNLGNALINYDDGPTAIFHHLKVRIVMGELEQGSELNIGPLAAESGGQHRSTPRGLADAFGRGPGQDAAPPEPIIAEFTAVS